MSNPVRILFATTLAAGLFEVVLTPFMDAPVIAGAFAVLFLACAAWIRRRPQVAAAVVAGLLFAVELAGLPVYERDSVADWIVQLSFGALSAAGLAAAVATSVTLRRGRRTVTTG